LGFQGLRNRMAEFLGQPEVRAAIVDAAEWLTMAQAQAADPPLVNFALTDLPAGMDLFRAECVRVTPEAVRCVMREHPSFFACSRTLADTYRRTPGGQPAAGLMVHARTRQQHATIAVHVQRIAWILLGQQVGPDGRARCFHPLQPTPALIGVDVGRPDQWLSRWIVPEIARQATGLDENAWIATPDWTEVTVPKPFADLRMRLEPLNQE
jgi:hypothetical protein